MASTPGRIPREAYRYWPTLSDSIHGHGRFAQRAIFKRQEYTELEEAALDKFDSALDSDLQLRQRARDKVERADLLRLLYAAEWDVSQALEKLRTYVSWYEQDLVSARSAELLSFQHVLVRTSQAAGGFYTFGRDCYYRPILVLVPSRLQSLDYIETRMLLPGQIEGWVLFIDMQMTQHVQFTVQVSDRQELKQLFQVFQTGFPCRLAAGLVWNVNRSLWERVTATLSPETSGKFSLVSPDHPSTAVLKTINRTQLETRFGGLAKELGTFWPPAVPRHSVYSAELAVPLSDYSSYQEYFPQRSLSGSTDKSRDSLAETGPTDLAFTLYSPAFGEVEDATETEEGPTLITPIRVAHLAVDMTNGYYPSGSYVRKRELIRTESKDYQGQCCCCLTRREDSKNCLLS